jgi:hypothetical protein
MDASAVLNITSWILSELIRIFHAVSVSEAQGVVNSLAEFHIPLVWAEGNVKRILKSKLPLKEQILVLTATSSTTVLVSDLLRWTEYQNKGYFVSHA